MSDQSADRTILPPVFSHRDELGRDIMPCLVKDLDHAAWLERMAIDFCFTPSVMG